MNKCQGPCLIHCRYQYCFIFLFIGIIFGILINNLYKKKLYKKKLFT